MLSEFQTRLICNQLIWINIDYVCVCVCVCVCVTQIGQYSLTMRSSLEVTFRPMTLLVFFPIIKRIVFCSYRPKKPAVHTTTVNV